MPKFTADFSNVSDEGGAVRIPPGPYKIKIVKATQGKGKESKQPTIRTEWVVVGPSKRGTKLYQVFSLQPQALFSIRNMLLALGYKVPTSKVNLDTDQWIGRECGAEIVDNEFVKEGRKKVNSAIDSFMSLADYEGVRTPSSVEPEIAEIAADVAALMEDEDDDELALGETSDDDDDDEEEIDLDDL